MLLAVLRKTELTFESFYKSTIAHNEAEISSLTAVFKATLICCDGLNVGGELIFILILLMKKC